MKAVPEAEARVRTLIQQLSEQTTREEAERWVKMIRAAFLVPQQRGGMKEWGSRHTGETVEVLEANYDTDGTLRSVDTPEPRIIRWNPHGVKFYAGDEPVEDRRFYGTVTLATTEDVWVGYNYNFLRVLVFHPVTVEDETGKV